MDSPQQLHTQESILPTDSEGRGCQSCWAHRRTKQSSVTKHTAEESIGKYSDSHLVEILVHFLMMCLWCDRQQNGPYSSSMAWFVCTDHTIPIGTVQPSRYWLNTQVHAVTTSLMGFHTALLQVTPFGFNFLQLHLYWSNIFAIRSRITLTEIILLLLILLKIAMIVKSPNLNSRCFFQIINFTSTIPYL